MNNDEKPNFLKLTAQIASSYLPVARGNFSVSDVLKDIHKTLMELHQAETPQKEPEKAAPVISAHQSVTEDHITCMMCGFEGRTLKRHLRTQHSMTPKEYREHFNLASDYPMIAPAYANARSEMAKSWNFGKKGKDDDTSDAEDTRHEHDKDGAGTSDDRLSIDTTSD